MKRGTLAVPALLVLAFPVGGEGQGDGEPAADSEKVELCRGFDRSGAAQELNLPSAGLRRRTGFEGLPGEAQLAT